MRRDASDLDFLESRGIFAERVQRSFFETPRDWRCPVCGASKYELIHLRANGRYFSGVETHHYGEHTPADGADYVFKNKTVRICYRCNCSEARARRSEGGGKPMSVAEMRASTAFWTARRRHLPSGDTPPLGRSHRA